MPFLTKVGKFRLVSLERFLPATRHSPSTTRHSPSTTRHSPSTTCHSPSTTRHSPSTTRHHLPSATDIFIFPESRAF
ncbi:hypothetical protein BC936DRAFT_137348 [Jimgerdemannia flammicorona]|uniref:Uncharacterized protein n=1 Tax=Jimgerdemannia flammicorona TaxID=994334 RepID=A0A433CXK9_9FUNG|nr:hypothetical protein BC936DRAFT_137348 [Jimgerdemannia flammicorona]